MSTTNLFQARQNCLYSAVKHGPASKSQCSTMDRDGCFRQFVQAGKAAGVMMKSYCMATGHVWTHAYDEAHLQQQQQHM